MRNTKRKIAYSICATIAVFGSSLVIGYQARSESADLDNRPVKSFVVQQRVLHYAATSESPLVRQETHGRRSDGSWVRSVEVASPTGEIGRLIEIYDLRRGEIINLYPFIELSMTSYYSKSKIRKHLATNQPNCASTDLSAQVTSAPDAVDELMGRRVVRARKNSAVGATETWVAPELDCYPLRESVTFADSAHNEITVTKVEEVEPHSSMFQVPPEYIEASPLQIEAAWAAKFQGHEFWGEKRAQVLEERYSKHREIQ